jgi:hypothetical protein
MLEPMEQRNDAIFKGTLPTFDRCFMIFKHLFAQIMYRASPSLKEGMQAWLIALLKIYKMTRQGAFPYCICVKNKLLHTFYFMILALVFVFRVLGRLLLLPSNWDFV